MALLPILHYPDPRLRIKAKPVMVIDDEIRQLVADMFETMYDAKGIGLAATQVNRHLSLIVMDFSEDQSEQRVFINAKITPLTETVAPYNEGCLSVPTVYDDVERPIRVRIDAQGANGQRFTEEAEGMLAVCIQHELDHLDGKLFVDYLSPLKRQRARTKIIKLDKAAARERQNV